MIIVTFLFSGQVGSWSRFSRSFCQKIYQPLFWNNYCGAYSPSCFWNRTWLYLYHYYCL